MLDGTAALALLLVAAFAAGSLNAVAGGGSFLTLPALVLTGMPAVAANATGTVALLPGYIASTAGFREDIEAPPGLSLLSVSLLSLVGGAIGATLLLVTDESLFRKLIPWLLLAATALFAAGPALLRVSKGGKGGNGVTAEVAGPAQRSGTGRAVIGTLAVAIYGGYFNGGLGILLLALFGLLGQTKLNAMNGLKNLVSSLLTAIAVAVYAWGGLVSWREALIMAVAATAGGYLGARVARRIPAPALRAGIVATGLLMAVLFFARG